MPISDAIFTVSLGEALRILRETDLNETMIAVVVTSIRSAAVNEEYARIRSLIEAKPPVHHPHETMMEIIEEWRPRPMGDDPNAPC
jgi:hypothetical protein